MEKEKAVYAPGELSRVRNKLGSIDDTEAKRMAKMLGGEVGVEKSQAFKAPPRPAAPKVRQEKMDVVIGGGRGTTGLPRGQSRRPPAVAVGEEDWSDQKKSPGGGKGSDSTPRPGRVSYWERLKMDRYAAQPEFDIKGAGQVLMSLFSFFGGAPEDPVSYVFVTKRMNEYYKRLESLVSSIRLLLPHGNPRRAEVLKKRASFAFSVLELIRTWNLDKITGDLARIQANPRNAMVGDFSGILKTIYRPLFFLEKLDTELHIKEIFKVLYKVLYLENPDDAKGKNQELIRTALASYNTLKGEIHYLLYPLLMKLLSDRWFSYENFFRERKTQFLVFIDASDNDRFTFPPEGLGDIVDLKDDKDSGGEGDEKNVDEEDDENDPTTIAVRSEKKAVDQGLTTLEILFPKAGWDQIMEFPDLYPYFGKMFDLSRGYEQISPQDPLHQMVVLSRILEELFFGLRFMSFGAAAPGLEDSDDPVNETLMEIINNWHTYLEHSYYKEYLPRVREYARILETSAESQNSTYAKRLLNELHWVKRLYFLPYYKFESFYPPPFQKKDITPLYPEIRRVRKYLTAVAAGLEQGIRQMGVGKKGACPGINNPWEKYNFQVPNPLSQRLDTLLPDKTKNNAALIFYTLAVATVLDYLVNNETSWIYRDDRPAPLFRSSKGSGKGNVSSGEAIDADALFQQSLKQQKTNSEDDFVPEPLPAPSEESQDGSSSPIEAHGEQSIDDSLLAEKEKNRPK